MHIADNLLYAETHEWVLAEGDTVTIGISDFAQAQLSDVTFVELPSVGDELSAEDEVGVVESVKAASDVYSPVNGTVTEVNETVLENPELINTDPYGEGWLFKVKLAGDDELGRLMDAAQYRDQVPDE